MRVLHMAYAIGSYRGLTLYVVYFYTYPGLIQCASTPPATTPFLVPAREMEGFSHHLPIPSDLHKAGSDVQRGACLSISLAIAMPCRAVVPSQRPEAGCAVPQTPGYH